MNHFITQLQFFLCLIWKLFNIPPHSPLAVFDEICWGFFHNSNGITQSCLTLQLSYYCFKAYVQIHTPLHLPSETCHDCIKSLFGSQVLKVWHPFEKSFIQHETEPLAQLHVKKLAGSAWYSLKVAVKISNQSEQSC